AVEQGELPTAREAEGVLFSPLHRSPCRPKQSAGGAGRAIARTEGVLLHRSPCRPKQNTTATPKASTGGESKRSALGDAHVSPIDMPSGARQSVRASGNLPDKTAVSKWQLARQNASQ
ncbi:MAG: hypothetical protein CL920_20880, partial [Deltaproteobacteria bacterium]|nr:hypothetical protein [Deltaproteobacteria bacterium]